MTPTEVGCRWSPYVYDFSNSLRYSDLDGLLPNQRADFEYSDGYSTQSARNSTMSMASFGGSYQTVGGSGQGSEATAQGDPPRKGQNAQHGSSRQASTAASVAGGAVSLGGSAGGSTLGRILAGVGRFFTTGAGLVATLPILVEGDTRERKNNYITLFRNVGENEYKSYLRKGGNFGINPGYSLPVKEFWMTPEGLDMWQSSTFAKPYTIAINVPTSIIGPNRLVQVQTLDGHPAAIVTERNLNEFNRAKTTIYISKTNE